jgi:hypothetical protein
MQRYPYPSERSDKSPGPYDKTWFLSCFLSRERNDSVMYLISLGLIPRSLLRLCLRPHPVFFEVPLRGSSFAGGMNTLGSIIQDILYLKRIQGKKDFYP